MRRFENIRVLVTGAAGGRGQCITRKFKHEGATVAVADRTHTGSFSALRKICPLGCASKGRANRELE